MRLVNLILAMFLACVVAVPALAKDPIVTVEFDNKPVLVGQPLIVRIKVLVPTFMPRAPVFPTFEAAGLIVRLPERSSQPISTRINGDTWSGILRTYRIYPMREGKTIIPRQELSLIYRHPDGDGEIKSVQAVAEMSVVGEVPQGARGLDPLILASQLTISQTWQVPDGPLNVGDAIVRRLEAQISGTSPLFIPPLLVVAETSDNQNTKEAAASETTVAQLKPYPQDPKVTEVLEQGVMAGSRIEQMTFVPQTGGRAELPDIKLSWYNLTSQTVETVSLAGRKFVVTAPPKPRWIPDRDSLLQGIVALLAVFAVIWFSRSFILPRIQAVYQAGRVAYNASAYHAYRQALGCVAQKDLTGTLVALDLLTARQGRRDAGVSRDLSALTGAIFGGHVGAGPSLDTLWGNLRKSIKRSRPPFPWQPSDHKTDILPDLNPFK